MPRPISVAAAALVLTAATAPAFVVHAQSSATTAQAQSAGIAIRGLDGQERTITASDLSRLTRHDTTVSAHQVSGRYSGVSLRDVLALGNAPATDSVRGRALTTYVTVEATDGYRVVFSLAELDPGFTDRVVILADRVNGQPLPASEGPYRIIVPGEKRPARWARQVARITISRAS